MAKLSYYPEGVDLHGKQKIYFACHPDDFDIYFKSVCTDLLAGNRDCVIAYNSERETLWDEATMKFELTQMRLLVIPVTARFLCKPSEVRDVELPFIIDNTKVEIPILPLMQESGLDEEYKRVFHDLQYLDKNESIKDHTALPYDQKLKNYLDSVIFSTELVKKIREAFDAYIFMSYRKMDRVYAQKLMKLIHKNDFCRDIAIWYDEFLTPGESFNHVIREALEKSKLFTLVVTPNILEPNDRGETNYVVQHEYPEAVKSGKPILPAEMVPTDLNALHEKLDNATGEGDSFPAPTDGNDVEAISQALQDKLPQDLLDRIRSIAIDENNTDPQHNFFIGLAYLGGIDVEVDHEKAVQLITSAAERSLPEAMEKLADMYKNGEGVERNYETSAQWLDKLVELWEKRFEETGTEDGDRLLSALESSGDAWQDLGRLPHARVKYERMISVAKDLRTNFGGCKYLAVLSISYSKIGHIYESKENFSEARNFYEKGLETGEQFAKEDKTGAFFEIESLIYSDMGGICESEKNFLEAKEWYEKDLAICELLAKTKTAEFLRDLSGSYVRLGDVCKLNGDISEAGEWYEKAREINVQLAKETETVESRRDLCVVYSRLADIWTIKARPAKAREFYMKSLRISRQLAKETATMEAYERLSEAYFKCALVDTPSISIYYLQKSEKICATLVEKCPDVVRYSNNLRRVRSTIDLVGKIDYSSIEKSLSKKPEGIRTTPEEQNSDVDKDSDQSKYVRVRIRVKPTPNPNKSHPKHKS